MYIRQILNVLDTVHKSYNIVLYYLLIIVHTYSSSLKTMAIAFSCNNILNIHIMRSMMNRTFVNHMVYADDICIISLSSSGLQRY